MHISDLHRGQERTAEVWAVVRQEIHDDVLRQIVENGPLDLIIFSGDMACKGGEDEFASVKHELVELWGCIAQVAPKPRLFIVPGNHDLVRPGKTSPMLNMADVLRIKTDVRDEVLGTGESTYRNEITTAFANYEKFVNELAGAGIPVARDIQGLLPGDCSVRFDANGITVGLVGINTAWTHLGGGDYKGKLDVSVHQLNSVVEANLPRWSKANHVSLLVTHHPVIWLNADAQAEFNGEIFHPSYFDAHLFGHMHDNVPEMNTVGAQSRRLLQASSLFGLEKIRGVVDRRHGFYFAKLMVEANVCRFWPRLFEQKQGRIWQVAADTGLLDRDQRSFDLPWTVKNITATSAKKN